MTLSAPCIWSLVLVVVATVVVAVAVVGLLVVPVPVVVAVVITVAVGIAGIVGTAEGTVADIVVGQGNSLAGLEGNNIFAVCCQSYS